MPRPAKRQRTRRNMPMTRLGRLHELTHGYSFFDDDAFADEDDMREGWESVREGMLPNWIRDHPGTRPYAWWKFDSPVRVTWHTRVGEHAFVSVAGGAPEPQRDFLERFGLLTQTERNP